MNTQNCLRAFSTAAKQAVELPLRLFNLEGRYATALYTAGVRKNVNDKIEEELGRIRQYVSKNAKLREYLEHPIANRQENLKMVKELLSQGKYSDVTHNFFTVLCENGRLNYSQRVIDAYLSMMKAQRGELQATVTSARELPRETIDKVKAILTRAFVTGKTRSLDVYTKVNPDILGGMIVEVGDKSVDLSVASKLKRLNHALSESL